MVTGKLIPLKDVNDDVFASGSLGHGVAIAPEDDLIVAPVDAVVTMTYPTGHAIGLTTATGQEILIHVGINTVKMNGRGFKTLVKADQHVTAGEPLIQIDLNLIEQESFDPTVMVLLLNTPADRINIQKKVTVTTDNHLLIVTQAVSEA